MAKQKSQKLTVPSVLSYERKISVSDGFMYGTVWEKRMDEKAKTPLHLREKSVRGTISNRLKGDKELEANIESANLQTVDVCMLPIECDTLILDFNMKILSGVQNPSASNDPEFTKASSKAIEEYIANVGMGELSKRYAVNIANGRFLWRNRVGADKLEVIVTTTNAEGNEKTWKFDGMSFSLKDFDSDDEQIKELAKCIEEALAGKKPFAVLNVKSFVKLGNGIEGYPSEELILDKGNSRTKKSKILYEADDIAAMHSQKIGNAIRTIDTWYPEDDDVERRPIAVEAYGSVTSIGKAYREPSSKKDFYTLFDKFALGEQLENMEDKHYVMAMLIRGGVFGKSSK